MEFLEEGGADAVLLRTTRLPGLAGVEFGLRVHMRAETAIWTSDLHHFLACRVKKRIMDPSFAGLSGPKEAARGRAEETKCRTKYDQINSGNLSVMNGVALWVESMSLLLYKVERFYVNTLTYKFSINRAHSRHSPSPRLLKLNPAWTGQAPPQ